MLKTALLHYIGELSLDALFSNLNKSIGSYLRYKSLEIGTHYSSVSVLAFGSTPVILYDCILWELNSGYVKLSFKKLIAYSDVSDSRDFDRHRGEWKFSGEEDGFHRFEYIGKLSNLIRVRMDEITEFKR